MHIKTNIEHNMIQIIVLAVCPLLMVVNNLTQALFFAATTSICFIASAFVCGIFNRYFSRNIKVFVTAVLSSFIVAIIDYFLQQTPDFILQANQDCFYAVLATICISLDVYCIDSKSIIKLHMIKTFIDCGIFAGILGTLAALVEIFGNGTILGIHLFNISVGAFFQTITFKLILLGIITIVADSIYRARQKRLNERKITFEKYVRKIRDEKMFIYDDLRRKKLLTSKVEINNVNQDFVEEINQKNAENQSIEEDIQDSLDNVEKEEEASKSNKSNKKNKKSKSKLHIDVDRQEREKLSAKKAAERAKRERGELVDDSDKKGKKGKKGKAKVERVYGSNSGSNGGKK